MARRHGGLRRRISGWPAFTGFRRQLTRGLADHLCDLSRITTGPNGSWAYPEASAECRRGARVVAIRCRRCGSPRQPRCGRCAKELGWTTGPVPLLINSQTHDDGRVRRLRYLRRVRLPGGCEKWQPQHGNPARARHRYCDLLLESQVIRVSTDSAGNVIGVSWPAAARSLLGTWCSLPARSRPPGCCSPVDRAVSRTASEIPTIRSVGICRVTCIPARSARSSKLCRNA